MSQIGSLLELLFYQHLRGYRLDEGCEREYVFAEPRKWRFDFAWPELLIAVEVEGGSWSGGSHTRGQRFEQDVEKYNEAALRGWRLFRFTSDQVNDGRAIAFMRRVFPGSEAMASG